MWKSHFGSPELHSTAPACSIENNPTKKSNRSLSMIENDQKSARRACEKWGGRLIFHRFFDFYTFKMDFSTLAAASTSSSFTFSTRAAQQIHESQNLLARCTQKITHTHFSGGGWLG